MRVLGFFLCFVARAWGQTDDDWERIKILLKDLVQKNFESEHFKFKAGAMTGKDLEIQLEALFGIWAAALQVEPSKKLVLQVQADKEAYRKSVPASALAYYDTKAGVLYALAEASLFNNIAREGTLQYLHQACPTAYDRIPLWLRRGLALYFGAVDVAKDKALIMNVVTTRENFNNGHALKRLIRDKKLVSVKQLLEEEAAEFMAMANAREVQAWALLWWLYNTDQAPTVQKLLTAFVEGKSRSEAYLAALGTAGQVNWVKWDQDFTNYWKNLKIEIADREEGSWLIGETEHYTIRVEKGARNVKCKWDDKAILKDMKFKMELLFEKYALAFRFDGKLSKRPQMRLYKNRDAYHRSGGPFGSAAYYSPATKELVGYEDSDETGIVYQIFCHEGCHQFFDLAFPGFYDSADLPMWFSEGLADCFGSSEIVGRDLYVFTLSGVATWRLETIKEAISSKQHPSLQELLDMGNVSFMRNGGLHYAQSWSFCHFLWNAPNLIGGGGRYKDVVIRLIDGFKAARPKEEVYRDAFRVGNKPIDLDQLETEWKAYVRTLRVKQAK